ncbi:MAG: efflux RND transporter permease subunit, partial [Anaerolineae bacterium]|nr:efflux RND transporter permease subunit [Anaerolineae bacterium]
MSIQNSYRFRVKICNTTKGEVGAMRWIVNKSLQVRFVIVILAAAVILFGIAQLGDMPVNVFPEFGPPVVQIQTEALGLSAEEVESLITVPMEADLLNGVAWLDAIRSESVNGLSSIELIFDPGTDPIRARQMVQERLTQAHALPNVSQPPLMLQPLSATNRVMTIGLSSSELSLIDMSVLARWTIQPRLIGVPGVANVSIWGRRDWQLQVQVDPERLHANDVTLDQIIETTGEALWVSPLSYLKSSSPGTAGWIDTPNQRLGIQHILPITSPADLAQVPIVDTEGPLMLGDVTDIVEDHQPLVGDALLNDSAGLLLVIEVFPGTNTLVVTRGVEDALDAMRPGLSGIEIDTTIFRPANYIEQAMGNLSTALLVGAVLVMVVLGGFFFGWRTAVISIVVIPISLITAVFILYLSGATFNTMVLAGLVIALGVIIDDAIIDVENIARRLQQRRSEGKELTVMSIVGDAAIEMRSPILYATLIILLAVLPVFVLPGLSSAFYRPLAVSSIVAIITSLAVTLIVTPALGLILLANAPSTHRESPVVRWLKGIYTGILSRTIHSPTRALIAAGAIVLIGLAVLPVLSQSLQPAFRQTDLRVQWEGAPGTSRAAMLRTMSQAIAEIRSIPGVRNVGSHVGRAITGDQVVAVNSGELLINLDPAADYSATVALIEEVIAGYPGLLRDVQSFQPEDLEEALIGTESDVAVRIYGYDLDVLREKALEVSQIVSEVDGVSDVNTDLPEERPGIEIQVDLAAAERYRISPGDVRRAASTLLSGLRVGNLYEEQKVFDVVVWGVPELRHSVTDLQALLIDTPDGGQVRLGDVADVRIAPTPIIIKRDAVSRYADVVASVDGRDLSAVAADIERRLGDIEFPLEYHAEVRGESLEQQASRQLMLGVVITIAIGSLLLLQACFNSWRLAFLAVLTLPVAAQAGGVLAAYLTTGGTLSLGSLFGFLAVLGIAVRNSIVLINHFQHLEQ